MGDGNKVEFLVAICALITSVVAIWIAWEQSRVMRAQQHGMVYPVLQIDGSTSIAGEYSSIGITVSNSGVGPAIIESVALKIDGTAVSSLPAMLANLPVPNSYSNSGLAGRALAPGSEVEIIEMRWDRERVRAEDIFAVANSSQNWEFEICYCSVFHRCWQTERIGTGRARRVESCTAETSDIFGDFTPVGFTGEDASNTDTEQDTPTTE